VLEFVCLEEMVEAAEHALEMLRLWGNQASRTTVYS